MALNCKLYETSILLELLENKKIVVESDCTRSNRLLIEIDNIEKELIKRGEEITPSGLQANELLPHVSHRTWSVDEIVEELKDIDAFDAAKYFFDKYGG